MTTHADFLAAIVAAPDEDLPRLIYADWLDEHGEPARAEFIRVQCALARLPDRDPQGHTLRVRELHLLGRHRHEWTAQLPPEVKQYTFRRGLIEKLTTTVPVLLRYADQLFREAPVCQLRLEPVRGMSLVPLAELPYLPRLRTLELWDSVRSPHELEPLLRSPGLEMLRELDLGNNDLGDRVVEDLVSRSRLTHLECLDLSGNALTDRAASLLAGWPGLGQLRMLSLACNTLTPEGATALARSAYTGRLTTLDLSANVLGDPGARVLADAAGLHQLRQLILASNRLTPMSRRLLQERFGERVRL